MSKSEIDNLAPEIIEVVIFNQRYKLRSKTDREHVQQIANLVDERMRHISSQLPNQDIFKIAVLAALNIADEMEHLRKYYQQEMEPLRSEASHPQEETAKAEDAQDIAESNKSWFEDFFEAKVETKERAERLSSQVSAKLQSRREPTLDQIGITSEDEG